GKAAKDESVKPIRARRPNIGAKLTLALRKLKHDACLSGTASLLRAAEAGWTQRRRATTMIGRPLLWRFEEGAGLGQALLVEVPVLLGRFQGVPPGRQRVQLDASHG